MKQIYTEKIRTPTDLRDFLHALVDTKEEWLLNNELLDLDAKIKAQRGRYANGGGSYQVVEKVAKELGFDLHFICGNKYYNSLEQFRHMLRDMRKDAGAKLRELSVTIGISHQTASNYETGRNLFGIDMLFRYATAFNVEIRVLAFEIK